jgi:hypothetical protein
MTRKVRRHLKGPGYTVPAGARKLDWAEHVLRGACDRGEVELVEINGRRRIPEREIERLKALFGPAPADFVTVPILAAKPDAESMVSDTDLVVLRKLLGSSSPGRIARLRELLDQSEQSVA